MYHPKVESVVCLRRCSFYDGKTHEPSCGGELFPTGMIVVIRPCLHRCRYGCYRPKPQSSYGQSGYLQAQIWGTNRVESIHNHHFLESEGGLSYLLGLKNSTKLEETMEYLTALALQERLNQGIAAELLKETPLLMSFVKEDRREDFIRTLMTILRCQRDWPEKEWLSWRFNQGFKV